MKKVFTIINLPNDIQKEDIESLLNTNNIMFNSIKDVTLDESFHNFEIEVDLSQNDEVILNLQTQKFEKFPSQKIIIFFINYNENGVLIFKNPKPNEEIKYLKNYENEFYSEYVKRMGDNFIVYIDKEFINKQRGLASYFIKKIGNNIFCGKGIMNISLPIFLFDTRTLLEMWVWQNAYCVDILEKAGMTNDPLLRLKYVTTFALTKLHLTVSQKKPFNPILGETFQCKIRDSLFYLEQTSHHPPCSSFYVIGKNYKLYGYNAPEVSGTPNSMRIFNLGKLFVEFPDKKKIEVYFPPLELGGTVIGDRTICFDGILEAIDEENDMFCYVEIDPDDRGFFEKIVGTKRTFPDYVKGYISKISRNGKFQSNEQIYNIISKEKNIISTVTGPFSEYLYFDGVLFWKHEKESFYKFYRMENILKSDSYFREDLHFLIEGDEDLAGRYKHIMEERQRKDRKLREKYNKE